MEGVDLLRRGVVELRTGRCVVECVVLESTGSVARPAGARMLVLDKATSLGTVGGGAPELRCETLARDVLTDGRPRRISLDYESTGMVCGGSQLVGIRALGAADLVVLDEALACLDSGAQGYLVTTWSDDGVACSFTPIPASEADLSTAEPHYADGRFEEPLCSPERAFVFGGGHVGRALVPMLASIGFAVTVFDNRLEVASRELFPAAADVVLGDYGAIGAHVTIGTRDYVCVMTHGHVADEQVVGQALKMGPRYLGCMGSRRKRAVLLEALERQGIERAAATRVELPMGFSLGAVTPAEIAVSIAARLIQVRAQARTASAPSDNP